MAQILSEIVLVGYLGMKDADENIVSVNVKLAKFNWSCGLALSRLNQNSVCSDNGIKICIEKVKPI